MSKHDEVYEKLILNPRRWLITGAAGFIGCNLLEKTAHSNQKLLDSIISVLGISLTCEKCRAPFLVSNG